MRIDSCRTCGENMQEFQRCDTCNEVTSMICRSCNRTSEEKVHAGCGIANSASSITGTIA